MDLDISTFKSAYTAENIKQALEFYRSQVAVPFSTTSNYNIYDYVVYDGLLYQSNCEVTAGEWNATQWDIQKIFDNNGLVIFNYKTENTTTPVIWNKFTVDVAATTLEILYDM